MAWRCRAGGHHGIRRRQRGAQGGALPQLSDRASAFRDYAQLLATNPRYRAALNAGGDARAFAQGLAQGGYATDPAYAEKLAHVATRIQSAQSAQSEE